jgi:hypothetical protein
LIEMIDADCDVPQEETPGGRDDNSAMPTLEQQNADIVFQLLCLLTDG